MKTYFKAAFAALVLFMGGLTPVAAFADHSAGAHSHAASYHDRTPVAHSHGQHGGHRRS